ncbi:MAG: acetolactate synthase small subunit [Halothermotrichaceae bacterium]
MRHILSVTVTNQPGVLNRITGLFSRRNYNIDSLNVGETEDPDYSRMTIVVKGNERTLEQVKKQLHKLIDVIKITELDQSNIVDRDLALIRVNSDREHRSEIIQIVDTFKAKIVDLSTDSIMIEVTGNENKIEALIEILSDFGIKDIVRTGIIALSRGQLLD